MEKIDTDYKQQNWKIWAEFFKPFNPKVAPLIFNLSIPWRPLSLYFVYAGENYANQLETGWPLPTLSTINKVHSFIHSVIHSFSHSFIHSFIQKRSTKRWSGPLWKNKNRLTRCRASRRTTWKGSCEKEHDKTSSLTPHISLPGNHFTSSFLFSSIAWGGEFEIIVKNGACSRPEPWGRSGENFHNRQIMSYLCQKCEKIGGHWLRFKDKACGKLPWFWKFGARN